MSRSFLLFGCVLVASSSGCGAEATRPALSSDLSVLTTSAATSALPRAQELPASSPPALFEQLVKRAQELAAQAYVPPALIELPEALRDLNYEAYRNIRFRPERGLWRSEPGNFEVQFFHPGHYYREAVQVNVVSGSALREFPFSSSLFSYDGLSAPASDEGLGFTGLRVHAPLNRPDYRDEVIVFQGASYFRSLGRAQVYGLSARALAIDTGEVSGEEFPRFTELTLVTPGESDEHVWLLALLDSKRAAGAYAMRITSGDDTVVEVHARLFTRAAIKVLGFAPLTSMFLFGEDTPRRFGGVRPEVHDSDGAMMLGKSGEWLYRPLRNPAHTTVSSFRLDSPAGFGLVQRDRASSSYEDHTERYQDRPSAWVTPLDDWGPGALRLLEIATDKESDDNIAALWVPDHVPQGGLSLRYRVHFGHVDRPLPSTAMMDAQPSIGGAARPSRMPATSPLMYATSMQLTRTQTGTARFVVEFAGKAPELAQEPSIAMTVTGGKLLTSHSEPSPHPGGVRVTFEVSAESADVELRGILRAGERPVSETWSYLWQPN